MALNSHRQASYRVSVVGEDGQTKRVLPYVASGSVRLNSVSKLKASGEITIVDSTPPVSLGDRVRVDYVHDGGEWALGVFWASTPTQHVHPTHTEWRIELLGALAFLDEDCVDAATSVPAGANVVDTVVAFIESTGAGRIVAVPNTSTLPGGLVWPAGTSKLRIVNDLLASINYWSVFVDATGAFMVLPYLHAVERGVAWRLREGENSLHSAAWEREQDTASVPNKVIVVSNPTTGDKPAIVGVATNENIDSPYSHQARGRWITHVEDNVEAASQEVADALAKRKLTSLSTPQASLRITHAPIPINVGQVVEFASQGYSKLCVVREIEYSLNPTSLVKSKLVEVVDL